MKKKFVFVIPVIILFVSIIFYIIGFIDLLPQLYEYPLKVNDIFYLSVNNVN